MVRKREAVRTEVRAAEIAACVTDGLDPHWTGHEMAGWFRRGDSREGLWPKARPIEWHAGWLASVIWEHGR